MPLLPAAPRGPKRPVPQIVEEGKNRFRRRQDGDAPFDARTAPEEKRKNEQEDGGGEQARGEAFHGKAKNWSEIEGSRNY